LPVQAVREAIAYCQSDPPELREDYAQQQASMAAMGLDEPNYDGKPKPLTAEQRGKLRAHEALP
jgi:hypothetical protein